MATRIEERFVVQAPVERVWSYLIDPRRVVTCLPGAELAEVVDDRTFLGNVKVKVGPVTVTYRGRVQLVEIDEPARRVRMAGEGREGGGTGSARMSLESTLAARSDGATEVVVRADVDVAGRLVQLGRGMIEQVSHQIFGQFSRCVQRTLEVQPAPAGVATGAAAPSTPFGSVPSSPPSAPVEPVRALPLAWRALVALFVNWLRRIGLLRRHEDGNEASRHHARDS